MSTAAVPAAYGGSLEPTIIIRNRSMDNTAVQCPMAHYRKLLIVSPIILAAIVMIFYGHPLDDWSPQQIQPTNVVPGLERIDEIQASSQNIPPVNDIQPQSPTVKNRLATRDSQVIATVVTSITLSGWVGTEFGEIRAGETVVLYSSNLRARHRVITGISGEFIFTDLKPSWDYALNVSSQGMYKRYVKFPIKLSFKEEVHNIVLEPIPLGTVSGRITDPYGRPVTGIELFIKTLEVDFWSASVVTDAQGSFSLTGFPTGKFELAIKGEQSLTAVGFKFDPAVGELVTLTIDVGPYSLRGRIYDESGQTFDNARVFLNWELQENGIRIRSTRQTSADANGEFQFSELGPGIHELAISALKGGASGQATKYTHRQRVNVGVDAGELNIYLNTL